MFLLVPAQPGCPGQNPESCKMVVCVCMLLQVNGHDLTMATHKKAVEYIGRKPVLNLLVYRKGMPQLQPRQAPHQMSSSYHSYPAGYRQQQQQHPAPQSTSANQPYYRQY